MATRDTVLSMDDVEVHFDNSRLFGLQGTDAIRAVDGVSLDIRENEVVALVGESGCGKTTLGKTAIGLQRPTQGSVKYRGQDVWEAKDFQSKPWRRLNSSVDIPHDQIRRSLQMIHQDPESSLASNYTVESILSDPLKRWEPDLEEEDRRARIYGLLEYVGMTPPEDYANRYPHQLSGGEQQRVALIRSLLVNPDLILADEAVSALDVSLRIETMDLMLELQEQFNTSFLFISHNLSNARYFAKKGNGRIGVMYLGEIIEIGDPDEIIHNPKHPYTKVLRWATGDLHTKRQVRDLPLRDIDIPDSSNPPSGCSFHTRCPVAREACKAEEPPLYESEGSQAACFRQDDTHEYWDSDELDDETEVFDGIDT